MKSSVLRWSLLAISTGAPAPRVAAQNSAALQLSRGIVQAGETFSVVVQLDGSIKLAASVNATFKKEGAAAFDYISCDANLPSGQTAAQLRCSVGPDLEGGVYKLTDVQVYLSHWRQLKFQPTSVEVIADKSLTFPTEAKVQVSFSQLQILRNDSRGLGERLSTLKEQLRTLSGAPPVRVRALLLRNIFESTEALQKTEKDLEASGASPTDPKLIGFFDDLRRTYAIAKEQVTKEYKAEIDRSRSGVVKRVELLRVADDPYQVPLRAEGTIRAMEENQLAFNSVISSKSFTFDLKVITEPDGARISYQRRGDPDYQVSSDPSTVTLTYLTKAIWEIKADKGGCSQSAEFNPFHEAIPSLVIHLRCK